jgi:predicted Holliday junction resolvase-like endonuclease
MNVLTVFTEMKAIYGFCPCCGELFRLSDATIFTKLPPPGTEFDKVGTSFERLQKEVARFEEKEESIREAARRKGQRTAHRRLRALAPFFVEGKTKPKDVKVLFHPVEYIVFPGLSERNCDALLFVDHPPDSHERECLQKSLDHAIKKGNIEWQTFRVDSEGRVVKEGCPSAQWAHHVTGTGS